MHLAVDTHGMPIRAIITDGTTADCSQASDLIQGLSAQALLADRGYDSNLIIQQALDQLMQPIIPPKKNRIVQRNYCKKNIKNDILLKTPSFISNAGAALLLAMQKTLVLFWLLFTSGLLLFGLTRDYTM